MKKYLKKGIVVAIVGMMTFGTKILYVSPVNWISLGYLDVYGTGWRLPRPSWNSHGCYCWINP